MEKKKRSSSKKKASSTKKKKETKTKQWGKLDRENLATLIRDKDGDIEDTSIPYIDEVRDQHFPHRERRNFIRNYREFAAAWDTEVALNGERKKAANKGKLTIINIIIWLLISCINPLIRKRFIGQQQQ